MLVFIPRTPFSLPIIRRVFSADFIPIDIRDLGSVRNFYQSSSSRPNFSCLSFRTKRKRDLVATIMHCVDSLRVSLKGSIGVGLSMVEFTW